MSNIRKIICLILVPVLLLSGCSWLIDIKELDTEADTSQQEDTTGTWREDMGPSQGGTLNLFMYRPDTLNPLTTKNETVRHLSFFVFDQLFAETEEGQVENSLAESYSVSQDGLNIDVRLRGNVYFHDGEPLSADDVVFTVESIKNAGERSVYQRNVSGIESIEALSSHELKIVLKSPDPVFNKKLIFPIVPRHIFKDWPVEGHNEKLMLIGTGPYIYKSYNDNEITLVRNDSYWDLNSEGGISHPIWIDNITFKIYPNESDILAAFQKKEVDIAYLDTDIGIYRRRTDIYCDEYESDRFELLVLSGKGLKNSPVSNEAFRKAILEYLCWYSDKDEGKEEAQLNAIYSFNPQQSATDRKSTINALLEAGYKYDERENILYAVKDGTKKQITLSLMYNSVYEGRAAFSEWISKALFEIGIKITAQNTSSQDAKNAVESGSFDMIVLGCRMPVSADLSEMPGLIQESLGLNGYNSTVLPLSRKNGAVLYHKNIRGPRKPIWKNIYNGWSEWYLIE